MVQSPSVPGSEKIWRFYDESQPALQQLLDVMQQNTTQIEKGIQNLTDTRCMNEIDKKFSEKDAWRQMNLAFVAAGKIRNSAEALAGMPPVFGAAPGIFDALLVSTNYALLSNNKVIPLPPPPPFRRAVRPFRAAQVVDNAVAEMGALIVPDIDVDQ